MGQRAYKLVGILGTSFCGSTVLSAALDCLPGVAAGGELHWAVDTHRGPVHCGRCGEACPVFDDAFFASSTQANTYDLAAKRLGCSVLVSSDKWPGHYDRFAGGRLDLAVLLWKPPAAAVSSYIWHNHRTTWQQGAETWRNAYRRALAWSATMPTVGVNLESFMAAPGAGLERLCRASGGVLPVAPLRPLQEIEYHSLGGNLAAHRRERGFMPLVPHPLPAGAAVDDYPGVSEVLGLLRVLPGVS